MIKLRSRSVANICEADRLRKYLFKKDWAGIRYLPVKAGGIVANKLIVSLYRVAAR